MIITDFLNTLKENPDNIAFYQNNKKYKEFEKDIYQMMSYINKAGINKESHVLLFINQSYLFYVSIIALLMYGTNVVIIDNFKDKKRVNKQIMDVTITHVLHNTKTGFLKNLFTSMKKIPSINVEKFTKVNLGKEDLYKPNQDGFLITFTSGSTSTPKAVKRSLDDLEKQALLTRDLVTKETKIIYSCLPVYTIFCLLLGKSIVLPSKNIDSDLNKYHPDTMISTIRKCINVKKVNKSIKTLYLGGAPIYYHEAMKLKNIYPNAYICYIYGATEASLMAKTSIDEYISSLNNNLLCMGTISKMMNITTINGEIVINGGVITNNYLNQNSEQNQSSHFTKDLGFISDNKIYIMGRIISKDPFITANYQMEMFIKRAFPKIERIAVLRRDNYYKIILEKKNQKYISKIEDYLPKFILRSYVILNKLPLDYRHRLKIDYQKLLTNLQ